MLRLAALTGPDEGRTFHYALESFVLGRAGTPDRDLQYPVDAALSREHLSVRAGPSKIEIEVLGKSAPLRIGAKSMRRARVPWGAEFSVGRTTFRADAWSPVVATPAEPLPRRSLSSFRIQDEIGGGFSSFVYSAVDLETGEQLAIKVLRPEMELIEDVVAMFLRETEVHATLMHPNVVRVRCVGRDKADLFIGMDLVDGFDLDEHVACEGPFAPARARAIGLGMLDALQYAHELGLIHRDVKPNNVMLDDDVPRLVDFGMAKYLWPSSAADELTRTGEVRGTPRFAPPECLRDAKRAGPAADVFGVGTTLYYALTGKPWFDDSNAESDPLGAVLSGTLVPITTRRPSVPPQLAAVVEGAIRAAPEDRWASAAEMRARLAALEV